MSDIDTSKTVLATAGTTLFDQLADVRAGMLGVEGSSQHMQPMTHFVDRDEATLWFITSAQTDLVRAVGQGARAHYCVIGKDHRFHACLTGALRQSQDQAKLDALWSPITAAWFEQGRDDPDVILLQLSLQDAAIWSTTDSAIGFAYEIAKANLSATHKPDLGEHTIIRFDQPG